MTKRKADQAVDAFSAPRSLLNAAHIEAKKRRMSKSGFYRYCLAREVGYSQAAALQIAEHAQIGNFTTLRTSDEPAAPLPKKRDVNYAEKKPVRTRRGAKAAMIAAAAILSLAAAGHAFENPTATAVRMAAKQPARSMNIPLHRPVRNRQ